jgi:hypothetical protein
VSSVDARDVDGDGVVVGLRGAVAVGAEQEAVHSGFGDEPCEQARARRHRRGVEPQVRMVGRESRHPAGLVVARERVERDEGHVAVCLGEILEPPRRLERRVGEDVHERDLPARGEQLEEVVHARVVDVGALEPVVPAQPVEPEVVEAAARLVDGVVAEPQVGGAQRDREPVRSSCADLGHRVVDRPQILRAARPGVGVRRHEACLRDAEAIHGREPSVEVALELGRARLVPPGYGSEVVVHVEAVHDVTPWRRRLRTSCPSSSGRACRSGPHA